MTTCALEQIKVDVAYCENSVRLIGISAGISYGPLVATHHVISDFASLRAIPNMRIIAPADIKKQRLQFSACLYTFRKARSSKYSQRFFKNRYQ
ncbi:hypothetical protein [Bartonella sp. DB5-6]|uniref:hypothetical protein n=1 Tax=Bartonella sp. DB5-6 TaxID=1094755 RepID=UPI001FDA74C3|nr:hypothetical protein [Bartonella sp. DB5-6]